MKTTTLILTLVFATATFTLQPASADSAQTSCSSSDPCSSAICTPTRATASASGSAHVHAWAKLGANEAWQDGDAAPGLTTSASADVRSIAPGHSQANAYASARDGRQHNSDCDLPLTPLTNAASPQIGCVSDGRVTTSRAFAGEVFAVADGLVAIDEGGGALAFGTSPHVFNGRSLDALTASSFPILAPTGLTLELAFVHTAGGDACSVVLRA